MLSAISENLKSIHSLIKLTQETHSLRQKVTLVAVSKMQPIEFILEAYRLGHRDFGENYVDELCQKAEVLPGDINWHMIGHVQSNKSKDLMKVKGLKMIHTVDSVSIAKNFNKCHKGDEKINVMVQINTSEEVSKHGVSIEKAYEVCRFIQEDCQMLRLKGFMTIGERGSVEDFELLKKCRKSIAKNLNVEETEFELSMGMSQDFEKALQYGSNFIRVGTKIFGERKHK